MIDYGHMKKQAPSGFTLVELLVVVAIIGLLATIMSLVVTGVKARARDARRTANIDQLRKGLDLYYNQVGTYPVAASGVCIDGTDSVTTALQGANVMQAIFKDPFFTDTTNCYRFTTDVAGLSYSLRYFLETSAVGTPGFHTVP